MQGSQLAGEGGAGVEMAPLTLLEGVTNFLVQSRAGLHHEAKTVLAERISSLVPGKSQLHHVPTPTIPSSELLSGTHLLPPC